RGDFAAAGLLSCWVSLFKKNHESCLIGTSVATRREGLGRMSQAAQIAGMAQVSSTPPHPSTGTDGPLPEVNLEVRHGGGRPTWYAVADVSFLIGSVPGCDLRLSGGEVTPLLCLIGRHPEGVGLRKLVATQPLMVNGRPTTLTSLYDGDHL